MIIDNTKTKTACQSCRTSTLATHAEQTKHAGGISFVYLCDDCWVKPGPYGDSPATREACAQAHITCAQCNQPATRFRTDGTPVCCQYPNCPRRSMKATGCCKCGATRHREDDSPVTWRCIQCDKLICRTCTLTIPNSNPVEYYEDTYCSDECRLLHEGDGSIEAVAQASVAAHAPVSPYSTSIDDLRRRGWRVASHYDTQEGPLSTFWLFASGRLRVSGEGSTDAEALAMVEEHIRELERRLDPTPNEDREKT